MACMYKIVTFVVLGLNTFYLGGCLRMSADKSSMTETSSPSSYNENKPKKKSKVKPIEDENTGIDSQHETTLTETTLTETTLTDSSTPIDLLTNTPSVYSTNTALIIDRDIFPSQTNSNLIKYNRYDYPQYVSRQQNSNNSPLLVFLTGTSGTPANVSDLMDFIARCGYRAIALTYNNDQSVQQLCPQNFPTDPKCAASIREKRIFGKLLSPDQTSQSIANIIDDHSDESIVNRLVDTLKYLNTKYPNESWTNYYVNDQPKWYNIAFSGHSQGAGMSAYIARMYPLNRVVLSSSPWDFYQPNQTLAPWIKGFGATPGDRWYGWYHEKEDRADIINRAYKALMIPADQVSVLTLEPNHLSSENPYHSTEVSNSGSPRNPDGTFAYTEIWKKFFGAAP